MLLLLERNKMNQMFLVGNTAVEGNNMCEGCTIRKQNELNARKKKAMLRKGKKVEKQKKYFKAAGTTNYWR